MDKGKDQDGTTTNDGFIRPGESESACVTRLLGNFLSMKPPNQSAPFRSIVIDEAHIPKNLVSYRGIGMALLGLNGERTVLLTGTPYCNGNKDLASLMTIIDPTHCSSHTYWWDDVAMRNTGSNSVHNGLLQWKRHYFLQRTKDAVLKNSLPPKIVESVVVSPFKQELIVYEKFEQKFLNMMECLRGLDDSRQAKQRGRELFKFAMAYLNLMRMATVHPMLASGNGRAVSVLFSPSRSHTRSKLRSEIDPKICVCCGSDQHVNSKWMMDSDVDSEDDDDTDILRDGLGVGDGNSSGVEHSLVPRPIEEPNQIVPLPIDLCACRRYAHIECVRQLRASGETSCPACLELSRIVHLQSHDALGFGSQGMTKTYCSNILVPNVGYGFQATAKVRYLRLF